MTHILRFDDSKDSLHAYILEFTHEEFQIMNSLGYYLSNYFSLKFTKKKSIVERYPCDTPKILLFFR